MSAASESVPDNSDKPKLFMIDVPGQGILLVPESALKDYPVGASVQDLIQNAIRIKEEPDGTWKRRTTGLDEMD
jgi:hypothetical protein